MLGSIIRDYRTEINMTQSELSRRIGRSRSYIHALEESDRIPSMETLINICNILKLDLYKTNAVRQNELIIRFQQKLTLKDNLVYNKFKKGWMYYAS